ncbi:unnamed protein product [Rhizophagus irregularis]|nr:unnamed protein product [Rhizophagus irregularis]
MQIHVSQLLLALTMSQNSSEEQAGGDKIEITQELTSQKGEVDLSKKEGQEEETPAASSCTLMTEIQVTNE